MKNKLKLLIPLALVMIVLTGCKVRLNVGPFKIGDNQTEEKEKKDETSVQKDEIQKLKPKKEIITSGTIVDLANILDTDNIDYGKLTQVLSESYDMKPEDLKTSENYVKENKDIQIIISLLKKARENENLKIQYYTRKLSKEELKENSKQGKNMFIKSNSGILLYDVNTKKGVGKKEIALGMFDNPFINNLDGKLKIIAKISSGVKLNDKSISQSFIKESHFKDEIFPGKYKLSVIDAKEQVIKEKEVEIPNGGIYEEQIEEEPVYKNIKQGIKKYIENKANISKLNLEEKAERVSFVELDGGNHFINIENDKKISYKRGVVINYFVGNKQHTKTLENILFEFQKEGDKLKLLKVENKR